MSESTGSNVIIINSKTAGNEDTCEMYVTVLALTFLAPKVLMGPHHSLVPSFKAVTGRLHLAEICEHKLKSKFLLLQKLLFWSDFFII